MFVPVNESVTFVAKFDDYADPLHPFMYHCHFANHEDAGMMGQFVVTNTSGINNTGQQISEGITFSLYPNPANEKVFVKFDNTNDKDIPDVYYLTVFDVLGRTVMMLPKPLISAGLNISSLAKGIYYIQLTDNKTKAVTTQKFLKVN